MCRFESHWLNYYYYYLNNGYEFTKRKKKNDKSVVSMWYMNISLIIAMVHD